MQTNIGYIFKKGFILLAALNIFMFVAADKGFAQAKLTATISKASVPQNSTFQITYTLTGGKAESYSPPSTPGLMMVGSSHSSGGGMTMYVNGQKVQGGNGEESWTYTMMGSNTGKFSIGPAKAKVGGQWVSSNSLNVEITKGTTKNQANNNQTQGNQGSQKNQSGKISDGDVFLKAYVNKANPMQGEQITVTYKIYTRIPVTQYAINKLSAYTGFWTQDLNKDQGNPPQHTETINGSKYTVAEIRKVALFPQKTGRLTIEPLEVECIAQVKVQGGNPFGAFFNDPFFNDPFFQNAFSSAQNVKHTLKSNALSINVSPLPENNKPDGFAGAVGNFSFSAEVDRNKVKQNEALTLKLTVKGTGNVSLIELPNPEFPSDFEVYDPDIREDIIKNSNPVTGTKTFEYLILPRTAGDFKLPALTFSYYDPDAKNYKTLHSPEISIHVDKGTGVNNAGGVTQSGVEMTNSDVRYANISVLPLSRIGQQFFNSWLFYLILLIPVALFTAFLVIWRRRIKLNNDKVLLRNLQATKIARKRLAEAEKHMRSAKPEAFFGEVSRALWGYVSDKFAIPLSGLSLDTVKDKLTEKQASGEVCDKLITTLNHCEYARFAPPGARPEMEQIYADATGVIVELEKELHQKKNRK